MIETSKFTDGLTTARPAPTTANKAQQPPVQERTNMIEEDYRCAQLRAKLRYLTPVLIRQNQYEIEYKNT